MPTTTNSNRQLQAAKARSQVPERVTRHGREAEVVVDAEQFERLRLRAGRPKSLAQFFAQSPLARARLRLQRTPDYGRPVKL